MFQLIFGIVVAIIYGSHNRSSQDDNIYSAYLVYLQLFFNLLIYKQYFSDFVFNTSYVKITLHLHINHIREWTKTARDSHVISTPRICPKSLITERALSFTDSSALIFILLT